MTSAEKNIQAQTLAERTAEIAEQAEKKLQQLVITLLCLGFFPLMYFVGTVLTNFLK